MTDAAQTAATLRDAFDRFRARRASAVTTDRGFLALVNTHWVGAESASQGEQIWPVAGRWHRAAASVGGLVVTARADERVCVDGARVEGAAAVRGSDDPSPSTVVFSDTVSADVVPGELGYALRVWDTASEALTNFGGIDVFEHDPAWVVRGTFTPAQSGATVELGHVHDGEQARESALGGTVTFDHDGASHTLTALPAGRALQIVFADGTSGVSTYSVGRFLYVAPQPDGNVVLDFNLAVLPPCAFSYAYNCPMPPAQNRLPFDVAAGEKNVLGSDGALLHGAEQA